MSWKQTSPNNWELRTTESRWLPKAQIIYGATVQIRGRGRTWWRKGKQVRCSYWVYFYPEDAQAGTAQERTCVMYDLAKAMRTLEVMVRVER